jgi:hypothetical protein
VRRFRGGRGATFEQVKQVAIQSVMGTYEVIPPRTSFLRWEAANTNSKLGLILHATVTGYSGDD